MAVGSEEKTLGISDNLCWRLSNGLLAKLDAFKSLDLYPHEGEESKGHGRGVHCDTASLVWHMTLGTAKSCSRNGAPGWSYHASNTSNCLASRRLWIKPFRGKRKVQKASVFCLGPIKLLLPCIVFLLQLAKYFCIKRSVSSSLPVPPVWLCSLKPHIIGVFAVVSDNFTNTELKYCCKNQTGRDSGEAMEC